MTVRAHGARRDHAPSSPRRTGSRRRARRSRSSPRPASTARGRDDLGGAIEGRASCRAAATRRDDRRRLARGRLRGRRAKPDGTFRFVRLAPGRWNVSRAGRGPERGDRVRASRPMRRIRPGTALSRSDDPLRSDLRNERVRRRARVAFGDRALKADASIETSRQSETTGAGLDEHAAHASRSRGPGRTLALRTAGAGFDARFNRTSSSARSAEPRRRGRRDQRRVRTGTNRPRPPPLPGATPGRRQFDVWVIADGDGRFRLLLASAGKAPSASRTRTLPNDGSRACARPR